MELSKRLNMIISNVDNCNCIADIGTDHGYAAAEALNRKLCNKVIATDINKGPLEKARITLLFEGLSDKSELRLGSGLRPINNNEVNGVIIAGMGGNLIRDIIEEKIDIVRNMDFLILQPAQNPEVLRKYLYENNFKIINEEVCLDEGKYYECFKVQYTKENEEHKKYSELDYEVSPFLIQKGDDIFKQYMKSKIDKYENIISHLNNDTDNSVSRRNQLECKIKYIKEMMK